MQEIRFQKQKKKQMVTSHLVDVMKSFFLSTIYRLRLQVWSLEEDEEFLKLQYIGFRCGH